MGELDSIFDDGRAFAERSGDRRSLAVLFNLYGNVLGTAGDLASYRRHAAEALRIGEQLGDEGIQRALAADLAVVAWWMGDLREALSLIEPHVEVAVDPRWGDFLDVPPTFQLLWARAEVLTEMGRLDEARATLDRAICVAREVGTPEVLAWAELWQVPVAFRSGDPEATARCALRAFDLVAAIGTPLLSTWANMMLGLAQLLNGDWDAAARAETEALRLAREGRAHFGFASWAHAWLAEAQLGRGEHRAAREEADVAIALARNWHARPCKMDGLLVRAHVLLRAEGSAASAEIEDTLARVSTLVEETGARCRTASIEELRAELAGMRGEGAARENRLREAHRLYREMGATGHAERLARDLGL